MPEVGVNRAVYGFLTDYEREHFSDLSNLQWGHLTHIVDSGIGINAQGVLINLDDNSTNLSLPTSGLISTALSNGVKPILCVGIPSTNASSITDSILLIYPDETIANIVDFMRINGYQGVNIDFENVSQGDRGLFLDFMQDLANAVYAVNKNFYVTACGPSVDWNDSYDYADIANVTDGWFILGYDYFYKGSTQAGPVAPLNSSSQWGPYSIDWTVDDYLGKKVDPGKLILGCPYYGYNWQTEDDSLGSTAEDTGVAWVYDKAQSWVDGNGDYAVSNQYDSKYSDSPWFSYSYVFNSSPVTYQTWYENNQSLGKKYDLAISEDLGGVGIWALGFDGKRSELWNLLGSKFVKTLPYVQSVSLSMGATQYYSASWPVTAQSTTILGSLVTSSNYPVFNSPVNGVSIVVGFNEDMDQTSNPSINFLLAGGVSLVINDQGMWVTNGANKSRIYTVSTRALDDFVPDSYVGPVTLQISGAKDLLGQQINPAPATIAALVSDFSSQVWVNSVSQNPVTFSNPDTNFAFNVAGLPYVQAVTILQAGVTTPNYADSWPPYAGTGVTCCLGPLQVFINNVGEGYADVALNFSQWMNTQVSPTVLTIFSDGTTVINGDGYWENNKETFHTTISAELVNQQDAQESVTIAVSGALDADQNPMNTNPSVVQGISSQVTPSTDSDISHVFKIFNNCDLPTPQPCLNDVQFSDLYPDSGSLENYVFYDSNWNPSNSSALAYTSGGGVLQQILPPSTPSQDISSYLLVKDGLFSQNLGDYTVEADMKADATFGLVVRAIGDLGQAYIFEWDPTGSNTGGQWTLEQQTEPNDFDFIVPSFLPATVVYNPGNWVHLKLVATGNILTGYANLNDGNGLQEVISGCIYDTVYYKDNNPSPIFTAGAVGIRTYVCSYADIKNFQAYTCSPPLPSPTPSPTNNPTNAPTNTPTPMVEGNTQGSTEPSDSTQEAGTTNVSSTEVQLNNTSGAPVTLASLTLSDSGTGNAATGVASVNLVKNGSSLASSTFSGSTAVFTFSDVIPVGGSVTYFFTENYSSSATGTYQATITGMTGNNGQNIAFAGMPVAGAVITVIQGTLTSTMTPTQTPTSTISPSLTPTNTFTPTITLTATNTPTITPTSTITLTSTSTPTNCGPGTSLDLSWSTMAPMPTSREGLALGVVNGILYAVGGTPDDYSSYLSVVEAYDPSTNTWSTKASMPTARADLSIGVVNGILYAVGGGDENGAKNVVEAYDPSTNTWTSKSQMPYGRALFGIGEVNGILYIVGGGGGPSEADDRLVEVYDPSADTWATRNPIPARRTQFGTAVFNGLIYIVGGQGDNGQLYNNDMQAYDPVSDTWTEKATIPVACIDLVMDAIDGKLYAIGGISTTNNQVLNTVTAYNPLANTWEAKVIIPNACYDSAIGDVNGRMYVLGGASLDQNKKDYSLNLNQSANLICATDTPTITSTPTITNTSTISMTPTSTFTPSPTNTSTITKTSTNTMTFTNTGTPTKTYTNTATPTITKTPTKTNSPTKTPTFTNTGTLTKTGTPTKTVTNTYTPSNTKTPTITPTPTATPPPSWRVNAGGSNYTDSLGNNWLADTNYSGTNMGVSTSTASISGTNDPTLYQTTRFGTGSLGNLFTYTFNLYNDDYQVTLKFVEPTYTSNGQRKFNVALNGTTILSNFDIFNSAGGKNKAFDEVFDNITPDSNGNIALAFSSGLLAPGPIISAIQIIPESQVSGMALHALILHPDKTDTPTATPTFTETPTPVPTATQVSGGGLIQSIVPAPSISNSGQPIQFFVELNKHALVHLDIFSVTGERLYQSSTQGTEGLNTLLWKVQNDARQAVASGIYLYYLRVENGAEQETRRGKILVVH